MNELEVRRVRNALARVVDAAPALRPEELAAIAASARSAPVTGARRARARRALAVAAVAAAVSAAAGVLALQNRARDSDSTAGATLVEFPEGSAVYLLTTTAERSRDS